MILLLRSAGWLLFGCGLIWFVLSGGTKTLQEPGTMAAMIAMPAGMLLTMSAQILAWRRMRNPRKQTPKPAFTVHNLKKLEGEKLDSDPK